MVDLVKRQQHTTFFGARRPIIQLTEVKKIVKVKNYSTMSHLVHIAVCGDYEYESYMKDYFMKLEDLSEYIDDSKYMILYAKYESEEYK